MTLPPKDKQIYLLAEKEFKLFKKNYLKSIFVSVRIQNIIYSVIRNFCN